MNHKLYIYLTNYALICVSRTVPCFVCPERNPFWSIREKRVRSVRNTLFPDRNTRPEDPTGVSLASPVRTQTISERKKAISREERKAAAAAEEAAAEAGNVCIVGYNVRMNLHMNIYMYMYIHIYIYVHTYISICVFFYSSSRTRDSDAGW